MMDAAFVPYFYFRCKWPNDLETTYCAIWSAKEIVYKRNYHHVWSWCSHTLL